MFFEWRMTMEIIAFQRDPFEHVLPSDHSETSTGDTSTKISKIDAIFLVLELIL